MTSRVLTVARGTLTTGGHGHASRAIVAAAVRNAAARASSTAVSSSATPAAFPAAAPAAPGSTRPSSGTSAPATAIASLAREDSALGVVWGDGTAARFPWVWLRDHCRTGARAWNAATHQRADATLDAVPADLAPAGASSVTLTEAGAVRVAWPADEADARTAEHAQGGGADAAPHASVFDPDWLRRHCAHDQNWTPPVPVPAPPPRVRWDRATLRAAAVAEREAAAVVEREQGQGQGQGATAAAAAAAAGGAFRLPLDPAAGVRFADVVPSNHSAAEAEAGAGAEGATDADAPLLAWLDGHVRAFGFGVLRGAPVGTEAEAQASLAALVARLGHVKHTLYGGTWDVETKPEDGALHHNDSAYGCGALEPHTDGTYWEEMPGLQLFVVVRDGSGKDAARSGSHDGSHDAGGSHGATTDAPDGASLLVDGFQVAARLRAEEPALYRYLRDTPLPFSFRDAEHIMEQRRACIVAEPAGRGGVRGDGDGGEEEGAERVTAIAWNGLDRGTLSLAPGGPVAPGDVPLCYAALRAFEARARDPRMQLRSLLRAGDCLLVHNRRVLHGRAAFRPSSRRRLLGCYFSQEVFDSRLRVLRERAAGRVW